MKKYIFLVFTCLLFCTKIYAQDIKLPAPKIDGGAPLMQALSKRQTSRVFSAKELDKQTLSNLLWAANGFNRSDKRTAPTASNRQELEIYVVMASGCYWYDAKNNLLEQKVKGDIRKLTGKQDFPATAPLNIITVADAEKQPKDSYWYIDAGFISQNVYLFCASEGLGTVVRAMFDSPSLHKAMKLSDNQHIVITQTVGYPK